MEESHPVSNCESGTNTDKEDVLSPTNNSTRPRTPSDRTASDNLGLPNHRKAMVSQGQHHVSEPVAHAPRFSQAEGDLISLEPPTPPAYDPRTNGSTIKSPQATLTAKSKPPADYMSYRNEYPPAPPPSSKLVAQLNASANHRPSDGFRTASLPMRQRSPQRKSRPLAPSGISRRPVPGLSSPQPEHGGEFGQAKSSDSGDENTSSSRENAANARRVPRKPRKKAVSANRLATSSEEPKEEGEQESSSSRTPSAAWEERVKYIRKHLPKGVDAEAAKQIFNEIVVQGDEVHWDDVAGLEIAKKALKEAVVYPFLRPDLFMGLREPARGMLLFGPPGTGKTMLARAVATESRSTFFAISASSLTSKWLGESEKLVRALFSLAKALAPSIIFVDEIDSLLSSRGGSSEHESTRRIKTEFLIQWSDLQKAAAGKVQSDKEKQEGDATRVLVLAATNLPWAIDEAARRRFVRRQYIPLPEPHVRAEQLRTLLGHQKHNLAEDDIKVLVQLTDGFSGSDITALAKDAAMGPLRSLGEALLSMSMDDIRPIGFKDFEASLINIRPSVSKQGLQEFEDWAKEFGERGG
ncbi:protein SAP1 [Physcia stellaris]|nr:protein SAP1 [Physcia stellaris]